METGLLGACLDSAPRVAEEVVNIERENATTQHPQMVESLVKDRLSRLWIVIQWHVPVRKATSARV